MARAQQPTPTDRGHILIVEDETGIRAAVALILEMEGFRVSQAGDGRSGLSCVIDMAPDLVITDYMMPVMNGVDMVRAVRAMPEFAELPVILLTAVFPAEPDHRALVDRFLIKPVDVATLIDAITTLMPRTVGRH